MTETTFSAKQFEKQPMVVGMCIAALCRIELGYILD